MAVLFLTAIGKLRQKISELEEEGGKIKDTIETLQKALKDNLEKSKVARDQPSAAVKLNAFANTQKDEADKLLEAQQEQEKLQTENLEKLESAKNALKSKYETAVATLNKHFGAGTSLLENQKN